MSYLRPIIRLCAVAAMRDRTWCDDRVYDSDNTPLADALVKQGSQARPYCVVFTDNDNRIDGKGTDVFRQIKRQINLILEIGIAGAISQATEDGQHVVQLLRFPHTDAAMEMYLDAVEGQALRALFGDPESPWCELLHRLVNNVDKVASQRGGAAPDRGVRWAGRQITITLESICDPPAGAPIVAGSPIRDFFVLAESNADLKISDGALILQRLIETHAVYPSWEQDQAWLGISKYALRSIGIAPLTREALHIPIVHGTDIVRDDGEAPDLHSISIEGSSVAWGYRDIYRFDTDPHPNTTDTLYRLLAVPVSIRAPSFTVPRAANAVPLKAVNLIDDPPEINKP